jgi:FAD/FMN-containing dehydrogenase
MRWRRPPHRAYVGPVDEGERAFAPVRAWGPVVEVVGPIPYAEGIQRLIQPGNPPGRHQYWKAGFLQELTDEALETFVSRATDVASPFTASILMPLGGAIARVPEEATVLGYRDADWNFHIISQWEDAADDERNIAWTRAFDEAMRPHSLAGIYVNFLSEPPEKILEVSFGPEKYARLVAVKDEYDTENVFRNNTNIPPSGGSNGRPA